MQRDSSDLAKKYNDLRDQRDREMSALRSRVAASEAEANKLADALNTNLSKEREWARERDVLNQQLKRSKEEAQSYHDRDRERGRDGRASPGLVAGRDRREEDRREIEALRAEVRRATTRAEAAEAESRQLAAAVRQKAAGDGAAGAAGGYHSQGTSPPPARGWAGVMSPRSHHDGTSDRELSDLKAELRRASDREAAHRDKLRSVEKTLEAEREYFKEETARCHATIVELRQKVIQAEQRASDAEVDASAKVNELKAKTSGLEAEAERAKGDILGLRQKEAEAKRRQQTVLKQAEKLALEVSSWAQDGNTTADRSAAELAKWLGQAVVAHGALSPRKALRLRAQLLENRIEDPPEPTTPPPSRVNRPLPFSRPAESVSRRTVIQSIVT
ncbi:hypothetical protein DIPPA_18187 [Diplonema papillatum]|nr:hypothetical protein DIPPA_18187 [Diplonema papillatum]